MRLELAGQSYTTRSLTAAAQACINLYAETIETASGSGKGTRILRHTPGWHLLVNLTAGNIRGFWSGGGRCFVAVGHLVYEISSSGAIISTYDMILNDALPVQFFGNGQQLGMITLGLFLINNGAGFVPAQFQLQGTVTAVGAALTWVGGDKFTPSMAGLNIYVAGHIVTVLTYTDTTHITLTAALGGGTGTGYLQFFGGFSRATGNTFSSALVGLPITIDGVSYMVETVLSTDYLTLANPHGTVFPAVGPVAFNAVQPNLSYTAAAGDPVTAVTGAYLDGAFYVQRPSGGSPDLGRQVNRSAVNDGTVWNGLDFFTKEGAADYIQSIFADREQLYMFGTETSEVWQNDTNSGDLVRLSGAVAKEGSVARYAVVTMQEHIYFLGGSPSGSTVAYRIDGFTPTRISTHSIEERWATQGVAISTVIAWNALEDGHYVWVICFSSGSSWVYDATEKFWHERASWTGTALGPYKPWYHTFIPEWGANGQHIVGDHGSGKVWIMDSAFSDEDGSDVQRVRDLPFIYGGQGKRVYVGRVDLDMDTGEIVSGAEPTISLQWSDDNGATISTPEPAGFGTAGQYGKRVFWIAQGSAETSRIPRITYTGKQKITLIDLQAEVDIGTS